MLEDHLDKQFYQFVGELPSRIFSRLTPKGTTINNRVLSLVDSPDSGQTLRYNGFSMEFNSLSGGHLAISIGGSKFNSNEINSIKNYFDQNPKGFQARKIRSYKSLAGVIRGLDNGYVGDQNTLNLRIEINPHPKTSPEELFEAVWYRLKPIFRVIHEIKLDHNQ